MSLTAGTAVGPYEILSLLGSGGMGEVYRARDALTRGYLAYPYLARHDWFLDSVRSDPRVRAVLEEIRERWEGFRE